MERGDRWTRTESNRVHRVRIHHSRASQSNAANYIKSDSWDNEIHAPQHIRPFQVVTQHTSRRYQCHYQ